MSRFVSEGSKADNSAERNDAWIKAKQDVEALKKPKQSATGSGLQEGGKSLYETLQANKGRPAFSLYSRFFW
jgi:FAM192A/Fyv6, N-terminal domain